MRTSRHKNIRRRFAVTQLSKNRLDKQNQVALSELLDSVYRIPCYFPCKAKNRPRRAPVAKPTIKLPLACPSTNQALTRPRNGQVSKPTKNDSDFAVVCLSVRSSFDVEILRRDESRPRSSIPSAVLARGKTKYRRKRFRQNLAHLPACAVTKSEVVFCMRA